MSKIEIKDIGIISSMGSDMRNADYFNVFTKDALFNYDISKKIYQYCLKNENLDTCYGINENRRIQTEDYYMDEIGNQISIIKIKVPNLGEGTAYISSPHLIDHNFIKKNIKFEPPVNPNIKFHIDDGLLCFGFFNMHFDIGYVEGSNLDFFKNKSDENQKKFNEYIKIKYKNILSKPNMGGDNIVECTVSKGQYSQYSLALTKHVPNSPYEKGNYIGELFIKDE